MKAPVPTFYFSLRSPYSWLAWHDLKTLYPKLLQRLRLVPFWEPDSAYRDALGEKGEVFLYSAMSREKHLYILSDVRRLSQRRGLPVRWPVDRDPQWEVPHLAYLAADSAGKGKDFIDVITRMRWQEGADICDPETVAAAAVELALDPEFLRDAHRDPGLREQGLLPLRACIADGVFGVPMFNVGRDKFWGIERLPDFIAAVASATVPAAPDETPLGRPVQALFDHAGGCG